MARQRTVRGIAKRIDPGYFRRDHPFRRLKRVLSIAAALAAAAWPAIAAWREDETLFTGGAISVRHHMLAESCGQCHVAGYAERYLDPELWEASTDTACLACHAAPAHNANQKEFTRGASAAGCSTCHVEHQGRDVLAALSPAHCALCHDDLARHVDSGAKAEHKEPCLAAPFHRIANRVTDFRRDHPEFAFRASGVKDPTHLRFNHFVHLFPNTPQKRARFQEDLTNLEGRIGVGKAIGGSPRLECSYCHQPEESGAYMKPVQYESHCRDCHALTLQADGAAEPARVPHGRPDEVRHFLRSFFLKSLPQGEDPADWILMQTAQAETALYTSDPASCSKCHITELGDGFPEAPPVLTDTGIHARTGAGYEGRARRWFVHSRFDHNAHRELLCTQCHFGAPGSRETSDLLLPDRAQCANCHGAPGGARDTCVECHTFHDHRRDVGVEGKVRIGQMKK